MFKRMLTILGAMVLLHGCSEGGDGLLSGVQAKTQSAVTRSVDPARVARGERLFRQHCAVCHGENGEGAPDWRQRDADGMFPPPPLNGTGHAWHHPRAMLHYVIANGSPGGGKMPAWKGTLDSAEIDDIISWFMSRWPDEVYQAWYEIERRTRQGG